MAMRQRQLVRSAPSATSAQASRPQVGGAPPGAWPQSTPEQLCGLAGRRAAHGHAAWNRQRDGPSDPSSLCAAKNPRHPPDALGIALTPAWLVSLAAARRSLASSAAGQGPACGTARPEGLCRGP